MKGGTQPRNVSTIISNMMEQLGVRAMRPGQIRRTKPRSMKPTANPIQVQHAGRAEDEGRHASVTRAEQWPARRAEIVEDFEREVYGRIPANVPKVDWEVTKTTRGESGGDSDSDAKRSSATSTIPRYPGDHGQHRSQLHRSRRRTTSPCRS